MAMDMLYDWAMFTTMVLLVKTLSRDLKGKEENQMKQDQSPLCPA